MSAVADARTKLYDALVAGSGLAGWRVHRVSPSQLVAPCVYLDAVELGIDTSIGAGLIVCTFPVVVVHDGQVRPQVEALDDTLAAVWTAAVEAGGDPSASRPLSLDVGGPSLRAHVLRVGMLVTAIALCAPSLVTAGGSDV
jgi:hypothetical protein